MTILAAVLLLAQISGTVVGITDGDTISVRTADRTVKVRLVHIDTPEPGQAFGTKAKEAIAGMVFGKEVEVTGTEYDRYKRLLGDVHIDGRSVNLRLVEEGFAWAYTEYRPPAPYFEAQEAARKARRGLWADRNPMPPWEYRKAQRAKAAAKKKARAA